GQRFVDRVVHDLPHQVVQTSNRRVADVHRRTLPHGLEAFEDLNAGRVVVMALRFCSQCRFFLSSHHRRFPPRGTPSRSSRTVFEPSSRLSVRISWRLRTPSSCIHAEPSTSTISVPCR